MFLGASTLDVHQAAFFDLGAPEVIIVILVVLLLFGGRKLPELARGTGKALRIFKSETKGLMDDHDDDTEQPRPPSTPAQPPAQIQPPPAAEPGPAADTPRTEQPHSETEH
ncbi:MAG: twin-arginine translocase TatA/TatE family subunit [Nocardioidaceae bacterium]